ncbi:hypothetical protein MRS44_017423 [Fusarium solani]|uniref:uncharacterized protein n=1 Tax=Fusarium solani TaxID=169388 RepID=UPI0032C49ED1|nr:hypothetical protein MRS44_017423 [Fusarium solani]
MAPRLDHEQGPSLVRHSLPCVLMRAGTSKGLFLHRSDLPKNQTEWPSHLISALGSRNNDPRQVDGVGGGTSTTSKVAVVSPSTRPDTDVDFTFVQVAVGKESVDFSGTCGNMSSGVGPFSVQEGLVKPQPGQTEVHVRIFNTNTERIVVETLELDETGQYNEDGNYTIPGVKSPGSEVKCSFVDPAGSMTGSLFPSGQRQQTLSISSCPAIAHLEPFSVRVTLIDAANPFVLVDSSSISTILNTLPSPEARHHLVELIRLHGAVAMSLAPSLKAAAQTRGTPKIALLRSPACRTDKDTKNADIRVLSYSMGLPHPSLQLTGAVCLGAAVSIKGTIAADLAARESSDEPLPPTPECTPPPDIMGVQEMDDYTRHVLIEHSKGTVAVEVVRRGDEEVASCAVSRTARRLFEGRVIYYV